MSRRLEGKIALITGAARGQGAAAAAAFAHEGARLFLADILDEPGQRLAEELAQDPRHSQPPPHYLHLDVSQAGDWLAAAAIIQAESQGLDILVNNAGVVSHRGLERTGEAEWDWIMSVNQKGPWLGIKVMAALIRARGGGSVINIGSLYAVTATADSVAYHASKAGLRMLTKVAAATLGPEGIRVNCVHPGLIATDMLAPMPPDTLAGHVSKIPLARTGRADEVAAAVLFLASDEAGYITGADLMVDGGYSIV